MNTTAFPLAGSGSPAARPLLAEARHRYPLFRRQAAFPGSEQVGVAVRIFLHDRQQRIYQVLCNGSAARLLVLGRFLWYQDVMPLDIDMLELDIGYFGVMDKF